MKAVKVIRKKRFKRIDKEKNTSISLPLLLKRINNLEKKIENIKLELKTLKPSKRQFK